MLLLQKIEIGLSAGIIDIITKQNDNAFQRFVVRIEDHMLDIRPNEDAHPRFQINFVLSKNGSSAPFCDDEKIRNLALVQRRLLPLYRDLTRHPSLAQTERHAEPTQMT